MNNIIIGTAGHIDHGKTTLIKALTGRNTDRLEEEKKRGITIDLGFTYFDLPNNKRAGIIDVPGHEKFVRNMLAGIVGMDLVLLIVAADEGIMPQTKEHLNILNLAGIENGIIVLTKCDLVDNEWINMIEEDISENVIGTFLENSPIIKVSSKDRTGLETLIKTIDVFTEKIKERNIDTIPRLPIDRVFTISGFGTVITGTLISGKLSKGQEIEIFPIEKHCKIRNIQVHGESNDSIYAGQRVAINLTNIKKSDIYRGCVIGTKNSMKKTMMIDVKLELLEDSKRIIENRTRLHLYTGTSEVLCRAVLIDKEELTPGESCYAQLRLEEEIALRRGDKFIVRFYSPLETIGGGTVLEPNPLKKRRFDESVIDGFRVKENGSEIDIIEKIIKEMSKEIPSIKEIAKRTAVSVEEIVKHVDDLEDRGSITVFKLKNITYLWHIDYEEEIVDKIVNNLKEYHDKYSFRKGIQKAEIKSKYFPDAKMLLFDSIITSMCKKNIIKQDTSYISLKNYEIEYNETYENIEKEILSIYKKNKFDFIRNNELLESLKSVDEKINNEVFYLMIADEKLIKINDDVCITKKILNEIKEILVNEINKSGFVTAARFRDLLNTNRKNATAILEYFDNKKITKRVGNERLLV